MDFLLPGLRKSLPAIVMAAGTTTMIASNAPQHVRYGGACLLALAAILADLQAGKKLGYTDKIVTTMRKVPGLENADEGTVLGTLCLGACAFLGGGEALNMAGGPGPSLPGALKIGYNVVNYPLAATFDFQRSRALMERFFGKELSFKYKDDKGNIQTTTPIPTSRLLQQLALISGAAGITTYGSLLGVGAIQFTGIMFALSNGMNIANLLKTPISEVLAAKLEILRKDVANTDTADPNAPPVSQQWQETQSAFTNETAIALDATVPTKHLPENIIEAINPIIAPIHTLPDKQPGVDR